MVSHLSSELFLRVLTINLFLRPEAVTSHWGGEYKDERMEDFVNMYARDYDVICIQEAFGSWSYRRERLVEMLADVGFEYATLSEETSATEGLFCFGKAGCFYALPPFITVDAGLMIASRFPITDTNEMTFTERTGTDSMARKGVVHAEIQVPGAGGAENHTVNVFTTHWQAGESREKRRIRSTQMREMMHFVSFHSDHRGEIPSIITGDFNTNGFDTEKQYKPFLTGIDPGATLWRFDGVRVQDTMAECGGERGLPLKATARNHANIMYSFRSSETGADPEIEFLEQRKDDMRIDYILLLSNPSVCPWSCHESAVHQFNVEGREAHKKECVKLHRIGAGATDVLQRATLQQRARVSSRGPRSQAEDAIKRAESKVQRRAALLNRMTKSQLLQTDVPSEVVNVLDEAFTDIGSGLISELKQQTRLFTQLKATPEEKDVIAQSIGDLRNIFATASDRLYARKGMAGLVFGSMNQGEFTFEEKWQAVGGEAAIEMLFQEYATADRTDIDYDKVADTLIMRAVERQGKGMRELVSKRTAKVVRDMFVNTRVFKEQEATLTPISEALDSERFEETFGECIRNQSISTILLIFDAFEDGAAGMGYTIASKVLASFKERARVAMGVSEESEQEQAAKLDRERNMFEQGKKLRPLSDNVEFAWSDVAAAVLSGAIAFVGVYVAYGIGNVYTEKFNVDEKLVAIQQIQEDSEEAIKKSLEAIASAEKAAQEEAVSGILVGELETVRKRIQQLDKLQKEDMKALLDKVDRTRREAEQFGGDTKTQLDRFRRNMNSIIEETSSRQDVVSQRLVESGRKRRAGLEQNQKDLEETQSVLKESLKRAEAARAAIERMIDRNTTSVSADAFQEFTDQYRRDVEAQQRGVLGDRADRWHEELNERMGAVANGIVEGWKKRNADGYATERDVERVVQDIRDTCGDLHEGASKDWFFAESERLENTSERIETCSRQLRTHLAYHDAAKKEAARALQELGEHHVDELSASIRNTEMRISEINAERDALERDVEQDQRAVNAMRDSLGTLARETDRFVEQQKESIENFEERLDSILEDEEARIRNIQDRSRLINENIGPSLVKYAAKLKESNLTLKSQLTSVLIPNMRRLVSLSTSLASTIKQISGELLFGEKIRVAASIYFKSLIGTDYNISLFMNALFDILGLNILFRLIDMGDTLMTLTSDVYNGVSSAGSLFTGTFGVVFSGAQITLNLEGVRRRLSFILPTIDLVFVNGIRALNRLVLMGIEHISNYLELWGERINGIAGSTVQLAGKSVMAMGHVLKWIGDWAGWTYNQIFSLATGATDAMGYLRQGYTQIKSRFQDMASQASAGSVDAFTHISNFVATGTHAMMFAFNIYALVTGQIGWQHLIVLMVDLYANVIASSMLTWFGKWTLSTFLCRNCALMQRDGNAQKRCELFIHENAAVHAVLASGVQTMISGVYYRGYFPTQLVFGQEIERWGMEGEFEETSTSTSLILANRDGEEDAMTCRYTKRSDEPEDGETAQDVFEVVAKKRMDSALRFPRRSTMRAPYELQAMAYETYASSFVLL